MSNLIESLNWRYAVKRMNGKKVPQEKLDYILEAIRLAPSSVGLQPIKVLVIEDLELRKKLSEAAFNQPQILECSHLLIFCAYTAGYDTLRDNYLNLIAKTQNIPLDSLEKFKNTIDFSINNHPNDETRLAWVQKQAYIALGVGITAAAEMEVDSTPMEGFYPQQVDEILGLKEKNLHSTLLLPLGYRDEENDIMTGMKKVRKPREEFFEFL